MALGIDDVLEGIAVPAVLAGVGLAVAAPFLIAGSRPLAKKMLHAYLDAADKLKEVTEESKEKWGDLLAEVQSERQAAATARIEAAETVTSEATG
jgi:hypothetical protein